VGIKGPLTTPIGGGIRSLNVALRQLLDLYVCLRPVRWFKGVPSPVKRPEKVDMVIFRENTEDIYAGIEFEAGTADNAKFLELVKRYWRCEYAKPTLMLFNICGPHQAGPSPHLDATTFRGVRIENTPVWMQNIMAKSGLFTDYLVKMAQVITWWYQGEEGTFTYWPDGPLEPPQRLEHPLWNRGVVVQNELMFHRGDPVGRPDERTIEGLKHRSLMDYNTVQDRWEITTDGVPIRTYEPAQIRFLAHWNAEVYADMDEVRKVMDHTDDLTHQMVVDRLLADMRSKNVAVSEPNDPSTMSTGSKR
jgi:hypothetical protein